MAKQQPSDKNDRQKPLVSGLKKVVKVILIAFICIVVLIAVMVGVIIYQGNHPQSAASSIKNPTGNTDDVSESAESAYIDTPIYDENRLYADTSNDLSVCLTEDGFMSIVDAISEDESDFTMATYYGLEDALNLYHGTVVNKSVETSLLTNGMLDADKLFEKVIHNNETVVVNGKNTLNLFYTNLGEAEIATICDEIAKVVNDKSDDFDIKKVANTLERLTIFERKGSPDNAFVTTGITFGYNPGMVEIYTMKQEALDTNPDLVWEQVVDHEIMHLIQYGANDGDDDNGVEAGFCRMYNLPNEKRTIPVDALYYPWILEAGAELGMADYLGIEPGTYQKKISYARSYNLSRFYEIDSKADLLENIAFKHTLEEVYEALGIDSEIEKLEFLKFMYSIEITQTEPEDFWEYYESQTGRTLTEEEKTGIRMDIRTEAVAYLSKSFFMNVSNAVYDGVINDLDTVFYLMRLWELDTFSHLNYTETSSLDHAKEFILWYDQTQNELLGAIAENSGMDTEQIQKLYSEYHLRIKTENNEMIDNCDLTGINTYMQTYVVSAKENYASSKFCRIRDVAEWLK